MKISPVGTEFFRADRRTDKPDKAHSRTDTPDKAHSQFRYLANASKERRNEQIGWKK